MGLLGQDRTPSAETRVRRNSQAFQTPFGIVAAGGGLTTADDGTLIIDAGEGLDSSEAGGLFVDLAATPGLEFSSAQLRVKIKANGGIVRDADGLSIAVATTTFLGGVLMQTLIADVAALTDNSGGTSGGTTIAAIVDPADTPVDADTLRDDLVANTIPSLKNAIATLAAYATSLEDKINAMIAAQKTANQMSPT